jgi:hypothetical protein
MALLLIVRYLWMRDQPERLGSTKVGDFGISKETMVAVRSSSYHEVVVQTQSIYGGREKEICRDPHTLFSLIWPGIYDSNLSIANGKLYYGVYMPSVPLKRSSYAGSVGSATLKNVYVPPYRGSFLLASIQGAPSADAVQKRTHSRSMRDSDAVRFRAVSMDSGKWQDGPTLKGVSFTLVGESVFWIHPAVEDRVEVFQGRAPRYAAQWNENSAHSDLMLTSLTTGMTRCIRQGVAANTALQGGNAGVSWQEPSLYPRAPVLFYARSVDGVVRSLIALSDKSPYRSTPRLVEFQQQLYADVLNGAAGTATLKMFGFNGDQSSEISLHGKEYVQGGVTAHNGSLYSLMVESQARNGTRVQGRAKLLLCRLHPERSEPVEVLHKLPEGCGNYRFEGKYLYFTLTEQQRSLWSTVTGDQAVGELGETKVTLCRFSLDN